MDEKRATPPGHADYRFLLANERTFLAYVRTALSLQVAGLGILQFLTHGQEALREVFGVAMVLLGSFIGVTGYRRFRTNESIIRSGGDMHTAGNPLVVALAVGVLPLVAAVAIAFG